jgi:hypothetical protein
LSAPFNLIGSIQVPDILPYLLAILCLTLIWKFHDLQVKAGRIQARHLWEESGVRLFLHATPNDVLACMACRETTGMVFSPAVASSKKFTPRERPCINPNGCRCVMVGLYGGWPEAKHVLEKLKAHNGRMHLTDEELRGLLEGGQQARAGASADRLSLHMLQAIRAEGKEPAAAIEHYRCIVEQAMEERDLAFVISAYLRLSDLLERVGQPADALEIVDRCLRVYGGKKKGPDAPTETQRAMLEKRKAHLKRLAAK